MSAIKHIENWKIVSQCFAKKGVTFQPHGDDTEQEAQRRIYSECMDRCIMIAGAREVKRVTISDVLSQYFEKRSDEMWSIRLENFLDIWVRIIAVRYPDPDSAPLDELLCSLTIMDRQPKGDRSIWSLMMLIDEAANQGIYGAEIQEAMKSFCNTVPGYQNKYGMNQVDKTIEQLHFMLLPFFRLMRQGMNVNRGIMQEIEVKNLAHKMTKLSGKKLSQIYELLADLAGHESWNHYSAALKAA